MLKNLKNLCQIVDFFADMCYSVCYIGMHSREDFFYAL